MKTKHILIAVGIILVAAASSINVYLANNSAKSTSNGDLLTLEALSAGETSNGEVNWWEVGTEKASNPLCISFKCQHSSGFIGICFKIGKKQSCSAGSDFCSISPCEGF